MEAVATVGLDLAKSIFQIHAISASGAVVLRRAVRRANLLEFFRNLPVCLVGIEACASAHYWAREIRACGHEVKMIPPIYVKAYVKRSKTDAADAEAICEAVTRPTMRFVPIKSAEQQAAGLVLKTRDLLVRQTKSNRERVPRSHDGIRRRRSEGHGECRKACRYDPRPRVSRIPDAARQALLEMVEQIDALSARIERLDDDIRKCVQADETARRLTTIPALGPSSRRPYARSCTMLTVSRPGRDFAAWLASPRARIPAEARRGWAQSRSAAMGSSGRCSSSGRPRSSSRENGG